MHAPEPLPQSRINLRAELHLELEATPASSIFNCEMRVKVLTQGWPSK